MGMSLNLINNIVSGSQITASDLNTLFTNVAGITEDQHIFQGELHILGTASGSNNTSKLVFVNDAGTGYIKYANGGFTFSQKITSDGVFETAASGSTFNNLTVVDNLTVGDGLFVKNSSVFDSSVNIGANLNLNFHLNVGGYAVISQYVNVGSNIYLNYDGPDGDSYLYFFDNSSSTGQSLKWDDTANTFVVSAGIDVIGTVTAAASGSIFNSLQIENDLKIGGEAYGTGYSSHNYILDDDSFATAIGKLDAAVFSVDVVKEVERLTSQIGSGSSHTIPGGATYTPGSGNNMDVFFNGQLLQVNLEDEVRDYTEIAGANQTDLQFTFDIPAGTYLTYIIRK